MKTKQIFIIVALIGCLLSAISQMYAQSDRTFVSSAGIDSSTCGSQASPCRSFNVAIPNTNSGGEVIALDSGIYDTFNIAIAIPLTLSAAPGAHVQLADTGSGDRVAVNTGNPGGNVTLRNLTLIRRGTGSGSGINLAGGGTLQIENCLIDGFGIGINVSVGAATQVSITNTVVRNSFQDGVALLSSAGTLKVSINRSRFENTTNAGSLEAFGHGVFAQQRSKVTIRDSVATGNAGAGFYAAASGADLTIEDSESSNNRDGVIASDHFGVGAGAVTVSNTVVTHNSGIGFYQLGAGVFNSLGNNNVRRNGTNTTGTINVVSGT